MLPCQSTCAAYRAGCHKTCAHWEQYQIEQRADRAAKKRYLLYHSQRCAQTIHQLRGMQCRYPVW
ncbi:MAG: hypothetical protein Q4D31_05510 [Eubacteriales bacterium]|nr:hypothetical protein [Eubacteriales bacterium]